MLLEQCQLPRHGLICERHVGVGLRAVDIRNQRLPLPLRDMTPISIEEQIICYADNFFSKSSNGSARPKTVAEIRREISRFGSYHLQTFDQWVQLFHPSNG
jgi:uncharacterized protein